MNQELERVVLCDCEVRTADPSIPEADALAVAGGVVCAVGPEALQKPKGWRRLSLEGRTVMPGLVDCHVHLVSTAERRLTLALGDAECLQDALAAVGKWAEEHPDDEWIVGRGWDHHIWRRPVLPTCGDLDSVVADRPVYLTRKDGHSAWVNSAALKRVRIPDDTSAELFPRDKRGAPLGIVRETLMGAFSGVLPEPDDERVVQALAQEQEHLWSLGIVGVHAMEGARGVRILGKLADSGQLQLKLYLVTGGLPEDLRATSSRLRPQGFKIFVDGSLGSGTAWMLEPDQSGSTGVAVLGGDELRAQVAEAIRLGLDPCVHAIGDRAVREVLDAFDPLMKGHPERFFRIEHAQFIDPADMTRVGAANLALSIQPCHVLDDQHIMDRVAPNPGYLAYAYASMAANGATLLMGTDSPVEPLDPWRNMAAAMERAEEGASPWHPEERLGWDEVLDAYTAAPARVGGWRNAGTLSPGKEATLVVVERDPALGPPWRQKVCLTAIEGRVVHSDGSVCPS